MKKIFCKNKKTNLLKHSYRPCDSTQNWSDSEHTQSSQTRNNGRFRMTLFRGVQTATLTLAMSFFITSPAIAQQVPVPTLDKLNKDGVAIPDSDPEQVYPESAYTLTEIENADPSNLPQNAITLYDKNDDGTVTPKYYTVTLKQTEYGDKENYGEKLYFKWEKTDNKYSLVKANESDADITYYVNNTRDDSPNRIDTDQNGADITANFKNFGASDDGGAIYNYKATIGNITGYFIGNYASSGSGGAIYNYYGTIGDITGDFIGNYASSGSGGAIYNDGTIGNITGDFIGNSGGAIYNKFGTIGDITGDFIGNSGGAIDNNYGTIGNITGDFIGNSGGAIYNYNRTIGDITGDFIGNYASDSYARGGAISNNAYDYKTYGVIGDIKGNFIGNYASGSFAYGGAIYSNGTIGAKDDEGNVVGGLINSSFIGN